MGTIVKALVPIHSKDHITQPGEEVEMDDEAAKRHESLGHVKIIKVKTKERKFQIDNDPIT